MTANTKRLLAALQRTRVTASDAHLFEKALNDGLRGQLRSTRDGCTITFRQSITVATFERVLRQAMKKANADKQPGGEWREVDADGPGSFGYHIEVEGEGEGEEGAQVIFYMSDREVTIDWTLL